MKVVAIVPQAYGPDKMLVEITQDEIGLIYRGERNYPYSIKVGTEIEVGKHWSRIYGINKAQDVLNRSAGSLRALADLLETIPVVVPPSEPEPVKEGGAK